ncbi:sigma factor-like helix-turn-helix DNA-binding protein [Clostridiaceae bacterium M8S5]|nr:sigma factor-like helix-turn-helix DNA-binding protein [Clostridiaceae bacterium M8S5]
MKEKLSRLIESTQKGDNDSLMTLYKRFNKVISIYNTKIKGFYTGNDLSVYFIELVKKLKLSETLNTDKQIYKYICACLRNECCRVLKKQSKFKEIPFDNLILHEKIKYDFYSNIEFLELLEKLTANEYFVIREIVVNDKSESSIANNLGITRQAVNKIKLKALRKLKKHV